MPFSRSVTLLLALTAFLFVARQIPWLSWFHFFENNTPFYLSFILLGCFAFILIGRKTDWQFSPFVREGLWLFLPVAIFFAIGISLSHAFNFLVYLSVGLSVITAFGYWVFLIIEKEKEIPSEIPPFSPSLTALKKKHGASTLANVVFITLLFFSFGLFHLTQFAAVDEPLWTDGRIARFWKNLGERDLDKTSISDKPGITLAIATGPGLWFATPKDYRDTRFIFNDKNETLNIQDFYLAFRLPLFIVITLLLPFFYFLLAPLLGTAAALYSYAFIALSPLLIGISKIVNPDSLLWVFVPLSFFSYLIFLEKKTFRTLLLSGVFLGLALLTKYVANFLIVYFFGYIFLRYLFLKSDALTSFANYFKRELKYFCIWLGTGLSVFYLLFPAIWIEPTALFTSTLLSEAFEKIAPLFVGLIALVLIDQYFLRSRFTTRLMEYIQRGRAFITRFFLGLFLLASGFTLANGMFGMPWINFMQVLSSPKSTYQVSDHLDIFLTNFYPLLFGIPVIVLIGALIALVNAWRKHQTDIFSNKLVLAIVIFILFYFLGSTVNQVVLINRYQIILYPLMGVLGGIGFTVLIAWLKEQSSLLKRLDDSYRVGLIFVLACLTLILIRTPFPLSFASSLLPRSYTIDTKDMGSGSYEAAKYLNSLPDARNLAIWSDKKGVCKFFVGMCADGFDFAALPPRGLDYIVISAGRESRTERMLANPYLLNDEGLIRFDTYYARTNPIWEIFINNRPAQFVKIFRFDSTF